MEDLHQVFKPAKLLISFMDHNRGEYLVKISKQAGARGGTIISGRSLAENRLLQMLSLADIHQDLVLTITGQETEQVLEAIENTARLNPKKWGGLTIVIDVAGMLFRVPGQDCEEFRQGGVVMESGYKLISIIVNHGYADDAMEAARKAGAKGGTIITARGTGTEEDVSFFGISLVPEKEMLLIVARSDTVDSIIKAVNSVPHIRQPGGGVVFYLNIERFLPLGGRYR